MRQLVLVLLFVLCVAALWYLVTENSQALSGWRLPGVTIRMPRVGS